MEIMGITISLIDVILGLFLLFCVCWGCMRGMTTQLARLCTLFLGITAARQFGPELAPILRNNFENLNPPNDTIASYIIIFLGVCLVITIITWFLKDVLNELKLKKYDRMLGGVIGLIGGSFFAIILLSFFLMLFPKNADLLSKSHCVPMMTTFLKKIDFIFPEALKGALQKAVNKVRYATGEGGDIEGGQSIPGHQQAIMSLISTLNEAIKTGNSPDKGVEKAIGQLFQSSQLPEESSDILKKLGVSSKTNIAEQMGNAKLLFVSNNSYRQNFHKSMMGANGIEIAQKNNFLAPWEEFAVGGYQSSGEYILRFVLSYPKGNADKNVRAFTENLSLSWPKNKDSKKRYSHLLDVRRMVPEGQFLVAEFALVENVNFAQWIEEADLPFLYFQD